MVGPGRPSFIYLLGLRAYVPSGKTGYTTIGIPDDLADLVDRVVKESPMGYRNRSEFCMEAIRTHVLRLHGFHDTSRKGDEARGNG